MKLGVQYYRPPFPYQPFWADDLKKMKESGLDAVQLWLVWGWIEPSPDTFRYEDYDELIELADKVGLKVVLSTIAGIHPYWIHRVIPGSEMIDFMGNKVVSSNRREVHNGLTPGGCFDHPEVWSRMEKFLWTTAERYKHLSNIHGWDAWNELRWNVQADGYVCYCDHTLVRYRNWLSEKYGGLQGLNDAWKRRYIDWSDVLPGKQPDRTYTEMMAFQHFLTWRSSQHAIGRYNVIKSVVPHHTVTVHGGKPSPLYAGGREMWDQALNRGNDWDMAEAIDGVGTSSFPIWEGIDDAAFGNRVEFSRSAAAASGKQLWLSEVQGGRSATGFNLYDPVDAASQQRWIWNGIASGADTILFWCWRNEIFGRESGGFGLAGDDGLAEERLNAMRKTHAVIEHHKDVVENYKVNQGNVGVLFSPQSYYLHWSQDETAEKIMNAVQGYCRALVRKSIPYRVVEEEHLEVLDELDILFLPRTMVTTEKVEAKLADFVQRGGTLVCESECGAFDSIGIYKYPEQRFTARLAGGEEVGRRNISTSQVTVKYRESTYELHLSQWLTPWDIKDGVTYCHDKDGALVSEVNVGQGKMILIGSYLGQAYFDDWYDGFENFLEALCIDNGAIQDAKVQDVEIKADSFVYIKTGESQGKKMVYIFFPKDEDEVTVQFSGSFLNVQSVYECIEGKTYPIKDHVVTLKTTDLRVSVLMEA